MVEIGSFLVIFSLEVGGKFVGLFAQISSSIVIILAFFLLIAVKVDADLEFLRQYLYQTLNLPDASDKKALQHFREFMILSIVLVIIVSAIYIVAGFLLVRGTRNVRLFVRLS